MKFSTIIVLGNLMNKEGELNVESVSRMNVAIDAFKNSEAPCIITCGWAYRDDSDITIADAMKKYAIEICGVPSDAVITETNSRDTVGDAVFTKHNIGINNDWGKVLVVTSDYHMTRALEIFKFVYGKDYIISVRGAATDLVESRDEYEISSLRVFHQTFSDIEEGSDVEIYNRLCERHPFYNGDVYQKVTNER